MIEKPKLESNIDNSFNEKRIARLKKETDRLLGFYHDVASMIKMNGDKISHVGREDLDIKKAIEILDVYFDNNFIIYPENNLLKVNQDYLEKLHDRYDKGSVVLEDLLSLLDALEYIVYEKNEDINSLMIGHTVDKNKYFDQR